MWPSRVQKVAANVSVKDDVHIRKLGRERALRPTDFRNFNGEEELAADYELF